MGHLTTKVLATTHHCCCSSLFSVILCVLSWLFIVTMNDTVAVVLDVVLIVVLVVVLVVVLAVVLAVVLVVGSISIVFCFEIYT